MSIRPFLCIRSHQFCAVLRMGMTARRMSPHGGTTEVDYSTNMRIFLKLISRGGQRPNFLCEFSLKDIDRWLSPVFLSASWALNLAFFFQKLYKYSTHLISITFEMFLKWRKMPMKVWLLSLNENSSGKIQLYLTTRISVKCISGKTKTKAIRNSRTISF